MSDQFTRGNHSNNFNEATTFGGSAVAHNIMVGMSLGDLRETHADIESAFGKDSNIATAMATVHLAAAHIGSAARLPNGHSLREAEENGAATAFENAIERVEHSLNSDNPYEVAAAHATAWHLQDMLEKFGGQYISYNIEEAIRGIDTPWDDYGRVKAGVEKIDLGSDNTTEASAQAPQAFAPGQNNL